MLEPVLWTSAGKAVPWERKRLRDLGRSEAFLEERIAEEPRRLLGLDPLDMPGPLIALRQCAFRTAQGRTVVPDVVVLSSNGHIAVVEAKLHDNPELRDRRVISQIVDYAAALSDCDEEALLEALGAGAPGLSATSWEQLVAELFRREAEAQGIPLSAQARPRLAQRFIENIRAGALQLVIACDESPPGLRDMVAALSRQSALDFRLHVAEVATFMRPGADEVLLVPAVPLRTEVVARTVVTVTYQLGQAPPAVDVQTTSLEEMESGLLSAKQGSGRRRWTEEGFLEQLRNRTDPVFLPAAEKLFGFLKTHAERISYGTGLSGSFNPRLKGFGARSVVTLGSDGVLTINYGWLIDNPEVIARRDALMRAMGPVLGDSPQPGTWPRYEPQTWTPRVDALLSTLDAMLAN